MFNFLHQFPVHVKTKSVYNTGTSFIQLKQIHFYEPNIFTSFSPNSKVSLSLKTHKHTYIYMYNV